MRLALGTAQFGFHYGIANDGGQVALPEIKAMLDLCFTNGLDMLDTAMSYGESERCIGKVGAEAFQIVTKLPVIPRDCKDVSDWVKQQLMESFLRLGVNKIYGLLLHQPDQLLGASGVDLYKALKKLKEKGLVEKVGISIYSPTMLDLLVPHYHFDLVQAPFNLVDRRLYNSGWLHRLKDSGIEVHARSVFLQGLLLMAKEKIPSYFSTWSDLWQIWHKWLLESNTSALEACIDFPLSFTEIDRVIVGVDNKNQLIQILSTAKFHRMNEAPSTDCDDENLINPANWPKP